MACEAHTGVSGNEGTVAKDDLKVKRRNIPVHIVFWVFVLGALYLFYKAFSGHP
jgi:hypothetical protein